MIVPKFADLESMKVIMETVLQAMQLKKYYGTGETTVKALDGVDLSIGSSFRRKREDKWNGAF